MSGEKETVILQIPESFTFGNFGAEDFDQFLSFFDFSLKNKTVEIDLALVDSSLADDSLDSYWIALLFLYLFFLKQNDCSSVFLFLNDKPEVWDEEIPANDWIHLYRSIDNRPIPPPYNGATIIVRNSEDREKVLEFGEKYTENFDIEYDKTLRYVINELLYNTLEHGKYGDLVPSLAQFFWDDEAEELSFMVADIGVGIRKHLHQTYPDLANDSEAILHATKPQISGTFGRENTGYETKNNAGVGLFFSSNIAQRLNADMFIVSGNGFVHISPTEIISKELDHQWKGTFVYVKIKLGLIEDLNLQKMLSEITKSIPKVEKVTADNNLYISVRNYFGRYAEDKDLAKKIRDEKLLPALAENKSLTIDFEEIVSAPHSLLNAMLATPIERLGLSAYKKIKIINAAPDIRETLDFIFDDNTSND